MNISERFSAIGEYMAAGMFEDPDKSIFYRLSKGLRRYMGEL